VYDQILIPTDGSDAAEAAVDHALDIAREYSARLHVLYVVDMRTLSTVDFGAESVITALEDEGASAVERVRSLAETQGVDAVTEVKRGSPAETIRHYAEDNGIDLVVMATHGRRGLDRYLLGSVTERVVRRSSVPVMTVRQSE
jgi:nucleotide-binding universal stress UspA family protein